ncbi:MAG: hypothetical protein LAN59_10995 [Acidobacteriia bacterium]|nr:hypothetical protein [Terriglobia bacterium]
MALAEYLPGSDSADGDNPPTDSGGLELLWSGLSPGLAGEIRDALDAARIFHKDTDKDFGILPAFTQSAMFIWIKPADRAAARAVLAESFAQRPDDERNVDGLAIDVKRVNPLSINRPVFNRVPGQSDMENEDEAPESDSPHEPAPSDIIEDFDPEDATAAVWAGESEEMAQVCQDCLNGVGIGCVVAEDGGKLRILVLPAAEARAREVVREITEQTPME